MKLSIDLFDSCFSQPNYSFVLDSENQSGNNGIAYVLKFNSIQCFPYLKTIIFRNNDSFLQLSSIKNIFVETTGNINTFSIICNDFTGEPNKNVREFKFIVDKSGWFYHINVL